MNAREKFPGPSGKIRAHGTVCNRRGAGHVRADTLLVEPGIPPATIIQRQMTTDTSRENAMMPMRLLHVLGVLMLFVVNGGMALGQTTGPSKPSLMIASTRGQDMFAFYCAACHGSGGKGDGPVAPSLRTPPADLTTIAKRAGGTFPAARVESHVTGTGTTLIVSHGTREMPVWGPIFRALDPNSDAMNKVRIANLVGYIESLQMK
jgi:mono/diheme cytochrome c family protein